MWCVLSMPIASPAVLGCWGAQFLHLLQALQLMDDAVLLPAVAAVAVVSNHCGWADILIHMARYFPAFVARDGTQNLLMVGLIR